MPGAGGLKLPNVSGGFPRATQFLTLTGMGKRGLTLAAVLLLVGCTRVVDDATPRMERPVAPIAAGQVDDVLSDEVRVDSDADLFASVNPRDCTAVAREVDAPFVFDARPAAHAGGDWEDDGGPSAGITETAGVYHSDFDAGAAVDRVEQAIDSCRDDELHITALSGDYTDRRVVLRSDFGSAQIVHWSLVDDDTGWTCENAFVAAHNAAIEITTCSDVSGYAVLPLATAALRRIDALADATT